MHFWSSSLPAICKSPMASVPIFFYHADHFLNYENLFRSLFHQCWLWLLTSMHFHLRLILCISAKVHFEFYLFVPHSVWLFLRKLWRVFRQNDHYVILKDSLYRLVFHNGCRTIQVLILHGHHRADGPTCRRCLISLALFHDLMFLHSSQMSSEHVILTCSVFN